MCVSLFKLSSKDTIKQSDNLTFSSRRILKYGAIPKITMYINFVFPSENIFSVLLSGSICLKDNALSSFDLFEYQFTTHLHNQIISALNNAGIETWLYNVY